MDWSIELVKDKNYVKATVMGIFNTSDHLLLIEDIVSQKYWKSGMNLLADIRLVDQSKATLDGMRQAASNMSRFESQIGSGKAAVLVATIFEFGKGRQFELLAEGKSPANIKIFLDESQAVQWVSEK
jgi:hypothetical protein